MSSVIRHPSSRILSGVQPTGNLHLGNYLGAIRNWVALQDSHECLFMLADLHAITVPQDPAKLRANVRETASAYIACGINPEKSAIFPQSAVSGHSELAWILSCHTPLGWLNRMTQFKEKTQSSKENISDYIKIIKKFTTLGEESSQSYSSHIEALEDQHKRVEKIFDEAINSGRLHKDIINNAFHIDLDITQSIKQASLDMQYVFDEINKTIVDISNSIKKTISTTEKANLGLYAYPVLMAADIILYQATHVPVGQDQKQHLELCRDIAGAFNRQYQNEFFPLPEPVILGEATRVMSLKDGTKKMSKSDESDQSRINLTDDADTIALKFRKAKSDMVEGPITYDEKLRPEAANLINIYATLKGITRDQALAEISDKQFSAFKQALTEVAVEKLSPITKTMRELMQDTAYLDQVLAKGVAKARAIADTTMKEVKDLVGFLAL